MATPYAAYLAASNAGAGDYFGSSLALSSDGNTLAVGAWSEDSSTTGINSTPNESATDAGAVYVFTRSGGIWTQQAYLKASNTGAGDLFGFSLALSSDGNTLAVGAPGEASSTTGVGSTPNESAPGAGAVYVLTRSAGTWSQQAYIKASNTGAGDGLGGSVALSSDGNTLAVGAPGEASSTTGVNSTPNEQALYAGAAYVFTRSAGTWSQQAYVKASNASGSTGICSNGDPCDGDRFGGSVALSGDGNTLAVGALLEDSSTTGINSTPNELANDAGAVYVFTRSAGAWSQQAYVKGSNTASLDWFGFSLALSSDGNTLGVGAAFDYNNPGGTEDPSSGATYVFTRDAGTWSQQAVVHGYHSVALSGDGNRLASSNPFTRIYLAIRSAGSWSQQAIVQSPGFLFSRVAFSGDGNTLAVGAEDRLLGIGVNAVALYY